MKIEICAYSIESALAASQGGADRVELCASQFEGGTTPSYGMMEVVRNLLDIQVFAIIRPRGGDFLYEDAEVAAMLADIDTARDLRLDGVVTGALNTDGTLDIETMKRLVDRAGPMEVTLHRAFDLTPDPFLALEKAVELGVHRILTSGQQKSAYLGIPLIKSLVKMAGEEISIMPGSGINEQNVLEVIESTGAQEFHVSARGTRQSNMDYRPEGIPIGDPRFSGYTWEAADIERIKEFRKLMEL